MGRYVVIIVMVLLSFSEMTGQTHTAVVADAGEGVPLDEIAKRDEAAAMIDHLSDLQALLPAKEGAHA